MGTVSDTLKLLDQIPLWKQLRQLPARVEALESRVAELENALQQGPKPAHTETCSQCGAPAKITNVKDHPSFAFAGIKLRTVTCENGHSLDYKWDPSKET